MGHPELREMLAVYRGLSAVDRGVVDRHLRACAECAGQLARYQRMDRDLAAMPDLRPARNAAAMRSAALHSAGFGDPAFLGSRWSWTVLASLAVLVMLVAGMLFFRSGTYLERSVAETPSTTPTPTAIAMRGTPHRSEGEFVTQGLGQAGPPQLVVPQPTASIITLRAAVALQGVTPVAFGHAGP